MNFIEQIFDENQLFEKFQIRQRTKLVEFFDKNCIKYLTKPNGCVFTTLTAINAPLTGIETNNHEEIEF